MSDPLVFAHRGASADLPEHTLAAYLRALDEGADGLECDVRLTRDGHLVCVHDRRLDRTSNGHGLVSARTPRRAGDARLRLLAPGCVRPTATRRSDDSHTRLLTLDRLLTAVRAAGRPVRLLIETKHPSRYGGDVERRLVALLRRYGLAEPGPRRPGPGHRDVLLAAGRTPDPRAGPGAAHGAAAGGAAAAGCALGRLPFGAGSPARASGWCGPARTWCPRCGPPATRSTSGPSTSRTTWNWSSPPGWTA